MQMNVKGILPSVTLLPMHWTENGCHPNRLLNLHAYGLRATHVTPAGSRGSHLQ